VDVDLQGVLNTVAVSVPHLKEGASIIVTGSTAGMMKGLVDNPAAGPGGAGYAWAKRIVTSYMEAIALQLAPHMIRVNAIHPTNCNTMLLHNEDVYRAFRVTIEGIAARAGVAKQTIYRWWPSKVDVLLDTLVEDASRELAVPDTGSAVDDARRYLRALARFLTKDPAGKVLLALIGEAQHDAGMARTFHQRYLDSQRQREREMLTRGIAAGELSEALDVDATLDALCGPVVYRALTGAPIPRSFADGLVTDVLGRHLA
jgi:AcrR family transcriptional regulator